MIEVKHSSQGGRSEMRIIQKASNFEKKTEAFYLRIYHPFGISDLT